MLVQGLPLRQPSPVDDARLCRLLVERSGGITLLICRALERAGAAAIRTGRERIDLASFEDPEVWRGLQVVTAGARPRRPAGMARGQA